MTYFKRFLWLAAWSVWLWLGFGLYRELPRSLGSKAADLPRGTRLGFIENSNDFVVLMAGEHSGSTVVVADASTGEFKREHVGPAFGYYLRPYGGFRLRHGLLTTELPVHIDRARTKGLYRLDLKSGEWRQVVDHQITGVGLHVQKPWVVFVESAEGSNETDQVAVVDWESGRKTIVVGGRQKSRALRGPFFVSDGDSVAVPTKNPPTSQGTTYDIDVWTTGDSPTRVTRLESVHLERHLVKFSPGGRIVVEDPKVPTSVFVYDLNLGRRVFPTRRAEKLPRSVTQPIEPVLSPSGRRVLGGDPIALRDVDTGEIVWLASPSDQPSTHEAPADVFSVSERWSWFWKRWLPRLEYNTNAMRSLETGDLILRTSSAVKSPVIFLSDDRSLVVADSAVYRLPLPMNWFLLLLCQSILALPLVLLWAVLRWRRRRRSLKHPRAH